MRTSSIMLLPSKDKKEIRAIKTLRVNNIALFLVELFQNHIGENKAISRSKLFKSIFNIEDTGGLADELRWEYAKRALHHLRTKTFCFVVSKFDKYLGERKYFVAKTMKDAQYYVDVLDNNIARMRIMQKRAVKSIKMGWHKFDGHQMLGGTRKMLREVKDNEHRRM